MSKKPVTTTKKDPATTGHEWDGIREFDNPMPRWWLWTFYLTIIWGVGYSILYPAWPLVNGATAGLLGQSTRADVAAEIKRFEDANAPIEAKLVAADLGSIKSDPELTNYVMNAGGSVFRNRCAPCHGSGAQGHVGYPNLQDDDWLWGGSIDEIYTTVAHGIRNTTDPDAHYSEMPRFGADELLEREQIDQVVNYVLQISGQEGYDAAAAGAGEQVYADNCASCHAEDGTGDRTFGAPNLTDAIWLYGGDKAAIAHSVNFARFGVMPAWAGQLSEADVRAVAAWVHSQGGGE